MLVWPASFCFLSQQQFYGKCPKISYTKGSDKMAYTISADPDQTAPWVYNDCHSTNYFKKQLPKKLENLGLKMIK